MWKKPISQPGSRMPDPKSRTLMCGNEAVGEAAIRAGCKFYAGYPITPQNELTAYMAKRMPEKDRTFIQAESEIAAINMVFGASAAGARAMTSSSSPGISLKQEGISYMAAAQLPGVIVNMMRGGPGLGNIAPSQSDYFQATKGGGHGDYHIIVLAPNSVQELFDLGVKAFDLADKYRTPVMILGDGMLGQMMEPIRFTLNPKSEIPVCRQAGQNPKKPWALTGCKGRKPNIIRSLILEEGGLEKLNKHLQKKYKQITQNEVMYEEGMLKQAEIVVVSYGSMSRICKSVVKELNKQGQKIGFFRPISLWPFPSVRLNKISQNVRNILVVEMSSGQMLEDVKLSVEDKHRVYFCGRMGGEIPREEEIIEVIREL